MQDSRSLNLSLGKRGFSRPLKYSLRTPATELMSWLFSSSVSGSLPRRRDGDGEEGHLDELILPVNYV